MDLWAGLTFFFGQLEKLLFSLGSHFSLTSLLAALIVAAIFLGLMVFTMTKTNWAISTMAPLEPTTAAIGTKFLGTGGYVLPMEIGAVLLLAAMLGAIVMAREK